jgi:hypothetical protein
MNTDPPNPREARMIRDLMQATEDVLAAWDTVDCEERVGAIINLVYQRYGKAGLCGLTSQLIRSSVPPAMVRDLHSSGDRKLVMPILVDDVDDPDACGECEDCKNYECLNSVMQYTAAVIANDPDMVIALFKANVISTTDERSVRWLSLVVGTACNTRFAKEES